MGCSLDYDGNKMPDNGGWDILLIVAVSAMLIFDIFVR